MSIKAKRLTQAAAILVIIAAVSLLFAQESRPARADPARYAQDIASFVEWDGKNSFPGDAVLFVGSSTIRLWPTREGFQDLPVINRGFGGSQVSDVVYYFDKVVAPYRAKVIVFYAGDNDIEAGGTPQEVRDDFAVFLRRVRAMAPDTPVVFLSIKPSPQRWGRWPQMQEANAMVRAITADDSRLYYVDVGSVLLDSGNRPRLEFYAEDKLHLSLEGYRAWARILTPLLHRLINQPTSAPAGSGKGCADERVRGRVSRSCAGTSGTRDWERLLKQAMSELGLSARAHDNVLRLARTIADIDGAGDISAEPLSEAIQYRRLDRQF